VQIVEAIISGLVMSFILQACKKLIATSGSWLMPATCLLCHQPADRQQDLCGVCKNDLPILPQTCPRCAKIFRQPGFPALACGGCLRKPPPFDAAFALFAYEKPVTKLIMELKFHERLLNARILGELMLEAIRTRWYHNKPLPDVIIPMPLHVTRLRERGFNQALEITRPIARSLKIPVDITSCVRQKATAPQARLAAERRAQNLRNAFLVRGNFAGRHIALLDDVTTTGHSINALASAFKKAGAPRIDVWFCARTLTHF
jgi:ComF family protein